MKNNTLNLFKAFVIGSSFFVVGWPLAYLSIAKNLHPDAAFTFLFVPLALPIVFGAINVLIIRFSGYIYATNDRARYWLCGVIYGLGLSLYGNFVENIPRDLFGLPDTPVQYITIVAAMLLYGSVFRYILRNLNRIFAVRYEAGV